MSNEECKINLFYWNNSVFIWNSEDWINARRYRVVGNFVGNLAAMPRQDSHEGLPLALLPEEATILLEKRIAQFLDVSNLSEIPNDCLRLAAKSFREHILSQQTELLRSQRKIEIQKNIHLITEGKMKKMNKTVGADEIQSEELKEKILQEEFEKIKDPKLSSLSVQIFNSDPWIQAEHCLSADWQYPRTKADKLRYAAYKDLWERGYYVTSGEKFGTDFLVYPGDPLRYHAFFMVKCVDQNCDLTSSEFIMYGRLGQSVRKTFVMAYLNDEQRITYQSIQWES